MSIYLICIAVALSGLTASPHQEEAGFTFPAQLAWTFNAEEREATEYRTAIFSSAVTDSTRVYFTGSNGVLYALYKKNGELAWSFSVGGMFDLSIYQFSDDRIAVASGTSVYCLNSENGIVNWITDSASEITAGLTGNEDFVYYGSAGGDVVCLDGKSGSERWRQKLPSESGLAIKSSLLLHEGFLYCGNDAGSVFSLSLDDGAIKWRFEAGGSVRSGLVVRENLLYFGSEDNYVYALNLDNGTLKWKQRTAGDVNGQPIVDDNYLYISARDRTLRIYKLGSGRPIRQSPINLGFNFSAKPLLVNDRLFFPQSKTLMARSRMQNFTMAGTYVSPADITSSAIYDADSGFIYFGCRNGTFVAIASADAKLKAPTVADSTNVEPSHQPAQLVQDPSATRKEEPKTVVDEGNNPSTDPELSRQKTDEPVLGGDEKNDEDLAIKSGEELTTETALHTAQLLMKRGDLERAGEMWQMALKDKAMELFTVNIGLYCQEKSVRSLLATLADEETMIIPSPRNGKICYFVCVGRYKDRDKAVEQNTRLGEKFPELPRGKIYRMDSFFS